MAVTKRTRYEVLKRDNHSCRYCGGTAPDVVLTVDHVTPVALGGSDNPDNLVAACKDCNAGKSSTSPDATLVNQVADDAIRWAAAIRQAAQEMQESQLRYADVHVRFVELWKAYGDKECSHLPGDAWSTIDGWLDAGLPEEMVMQCLTIALDNHAVQWPNVFRYTAGCARNKLAELHERAKEIVSDGA